MWPFQCRLVYRFYTLLYPVTSSTYRCLFCKTHPFCRFLPGTLFSYKLHKLFLVYSVTTNSSLGPLLQLLRNLTSLCVIQRLEVFMDPKMRRTRHFSYVLKLVSLTRYILYKSLLVRQNRFYMTFSISCLHLGEYSDKIIRSSVSCHITWFHDRSFIHLNISLRPIYNMNLGCFKPRLNLPHTFVFIKLLLTF